MIRYLRLIEIACLIALLIRAEAPVHAQQASPKPDESRKAAPLVIEMFQMASISESTVCLGDVAKIRGGSETARKALAALDLVDCDLSGRSAAVTRQQVSFRLRLAGWETGQFRMTGSTFTTLAPVRTEITEEKALECIKQRLQERFLCKAEDLKLTLAQADHGPWPLLAKEDEVKVEVILPRSGPLLGSLKAELAIFKNGARVQSIPLSVRGALFQTKTVVLTQLEKDDRFTAETVHTEREELTSSPNRAWWSGDLAKYKAKQRLAPGHVLTSQDVEPLEEANPLLVKQNQLVKMIAQAGPVLITTHGECLTNGRLGETVRVRNLDSKAIVFARVVDRACVQVSY
jgi:flagellar basal body P-ring formation protein FlgA